MAALLFLFSCGAADGKGENDNIAAHFEAVNGFTAQVKILSDLGQSTLEYTADYEYNKGDADKMSLISPEALAGLAISVAGEQTSELTVQYADAVLDSGMPARPGATPADAVAALLYELRASAPAELWSETVAGEKMTVARYENDADESKISRQVWLGEKDLHPVCAEVYADGSRVLQLFFSNYSEK